MLRQVQSDRSNLAHGWLPFAAASIRQQFGTQMPQGGHPLHHSITSSARNTIDSGTVSAGALAFLAFSAVIVSIGKFPSPGSEPERVFASGQPAIADEILGVERRCFTASLLGTRTRSGRERRAQAGIDVVIAEGLL